MDDPIPTGFITLLEALRRLQGCVSDAHLEGAKIDFENDHRAFEQHLRDVKAGEAAEGGFIGPLSHWDQLPEKLFYSSKQDFAGVKLRVALQSGALAATVRDPGTRESFRLSQADLRFEASCEQIIRAGFIPASASGRFERHRGRTVLLATHDFEEWLTTEKKTWPEASREDLCYHWLLREMRASPNDKGKIKTEWFEEAKAQFHVSEREFNRAWSSAITETGSNWNRHGAPRNPRGKSPH
jgi:hypothetical protein